MNPQSKKPNGGQASGGLGVSRDKILIDIAEVNSGLQELVERRESGRLRTDDIVLLKIALNRSARGLKGSNDAGSNQDGAQQLEAIR